MPSVEKNGPGFRAVWRDGGKKHKGPTRALKREAQQDARDIAAQLLTKKNDLLARKLRISWDELLERWIANRAAAGRTDRYLTQARVAMRRLADARQWRTTADVTAATVDGIGVSDARVLRALLRYATLLDQPVDLRLIRLIRPKTPRKRPKDLLTDDLADKLLAKATAVAPGGGALAHLIVTYGHRAQSLVGLTASGFDLDRGEISIPLKNGDRHRHPLLPQTITLLRSYLRRRADRTNGSPIFVDQTGQPWPHGQAYAAWWWHYVAGHWPGRGILDLRRLAITRLLMATNSDAKTVASITGHRTPSLLLDVYARTTEHRQQDALSKLAAMSGAPKCTLDKT